MKARDTTLLSRKFIAYLIAEGTWTLLVFLGLWRMEQLWHEPDASRLGGVGLTSLLMAMTVVKGFIEAGFIGSQAWLDRYVKVAEIALEKDKPDSPV